jgi:hypothetical protein
MIRSLHSSLLLLSGILPLVPAGLAAAAQGARPPWMSEAAVALETDLVAAHGEPQRPRIRRGLAQVGGLWREEDGDRRAFEEFVRGNFAGDPATLDAMFRRFEDLLEKLAGHMNEIVVAFRSQADLDLGPILPFDELFAAYNPADHVADDMFRNKLAFVVLLNFPLTTLPERREQGPSWSRRQWAEARLAEGFRNRVPAEVNQAISQAASEAGQYIAEYNIWMHHLLAADGSRPFPPGMRLLSHWNLRDEIKAQYANGDAGLARQRMIQTVMDRIVTQTIPRSVIDNPHADWNPVANEVRAAAANDAGGEPPAGMTPGAEREPDTRYAMLLKTFQAVRRADPYSPTAPTWIARRFDQDREIPEERVRAILEQVLTSPQFARVAALIGDRLGRPLEPFDIWYNGFRAAGTRPQEELDRIVRERYPTPEAYRDDIPRLLGLLGFSEERAQFLADRILVQPARGSGHAWGAEMRGAPSRLRTRVGADGMDYKGFNIAVHEMGHNVEQVLSLEEIDYTLLHGVPNTAFTEALAFVFQARDLELLGLAAPDARAEAMKALGDFWGTCEIGAVALVDMAVWHWMYDHPDATPAELREATVRIARETWNRFFAPAFGARDVELLAIYSHMIDSFLYLPDYPIGHLIAFQVDEQMRKAGAIGPEFERMVKTGSVVPDLWMVQATGRPVGPEALLQATERALRELGAR